MTSLARVISLANGSSPPENGMEMHFAKVLAGEAGPCSEEERAWLYMLKVAEKITPSELLQNLAQVKSDAEKMSTLETKIDWAKERETECRSEAKRLREALESTRNLLVDYEFQYGPLPHCEQYHRDENWKKLEQPQLAQWRKLRKANYLSIPAEIEAKELHKPEWLRGVSGAGEPARAYWVAADKDGNPQTS